MEIQTDTRTNYCIMVSMHTEDAQKCLDNPETVRKIVGDAFDSIPKNYDHAPASIEEEIDYTLDVYRTECDKDVMTNRIRGLEAQVQRLKEALAKCERCLTELYPSEPCKPEHENEYYVVNAVINQARAALSGE